MAILEEALRFPGHGATCEADDDRGTDFGRCGYPAYTIAFHKGKDRVVCRDHYDRLPKEEENDPSA